MIHVEVTNSKDSGSKQNLLMWVQYLYPQDHFYSPKYNNDLDGPYEKTDFDILEDLADSYGLWNNLPRSSYVQEVFMCESGEIETVQRILKPSPLELPKLVTVCKLFAAQVNSNELGAKYCPKDDSILSAGIASHVSGNQEKEIGRKIALSRALSRYYQRHVPYSSINSYIDSKGNREYTVVI
jgi:hypothetical protein